MWRCSSDRLFDTLLAVIKVLPMKNVVDSYESNTKKISTHQLVRDLLYSMPSNSGIIERVRSTAQVPFDDNIIHLLKLNMGKRKIL